MKSKDSNMKLNAFFSSVVGTNDGFVKAVILQICEAKNYQKLSIAGSSVSFSYCPHNLIIAKVVRRVQQWNAGQAQDVTNLMQAMGAQEHDKAVLDFWGAGCV